jgi:hypothetical protein
VWFTTTADDNGILIQTGRDTWKAKRIRRGSPVLIWIGAANGPAFIGKAEITSDAAVQKKILDDFRKKYWQNRVMGVGPSRARSRQRRTSSDSDHTGARPAGRLQLSSWYSGAAA